METAILPPEIPQIAGLTEDQVITLMNCRGFEQFKSMLEDYAAERCPFCALNPKKNRVLYTSEGWRVWENPFPLKYTDLHLIMAPIDHVTVPTGPDWRSIGDILEWATEKYSIEGGGFVMRFGTPKFNAGSVLHLHGNLIIPNRAGDVQVTLAKKPEKVIETIKRMNIFLKLYKGECTPEELSAEERLLVAGRL